MYEKKNRGWLKHLDFIILDMACLQGALVLAYILRFGVENPYQKTEYLNLAIVYALLDFCVAMISDSFKNILKRGCYKEFLSVLRHVFLVEGLILFYLFATQKGDVYSRISFLLMAALYIPLTYVGRLLWKSRLKKGGLQKARKSLVVIAPLEELPACIENICGRDCQAYRFVGAVATDKPLKGKLVGGVPIVAAYEEAAEYICREWVDEAFLLPPPHAYPAGLLEELHRMGVVTHVAVAKAGGHANKQQVERMGSYTVLTTSLNCATPTQLLAKRGMDIAGGLAGCLLTGALALLLGPVIYLSSPGSVFFSQERVGRNGRKFKMYKFRTMHPDAEERKRELQGENRVEGGMMFKLDYDPRVIGNKKLADGRVKEGVGSFLRKTSLDEFPQFFNILKGDMSLVGTRPPTVDEWEKYEPHHRARLAFRPGLTGLWQVSGRSNITDFEEVVKLDREYIDQWSVGLDVKILLKTIRVVLKNDGAM